MLGLGLGLGAGLGASLLLIADCRCTIPGIGVRLPVHDTGPNSYTRSTADNIDDD